MAVYGLVDAPFEFYKALDRFLCFHEVWEEQLQWTITQCPEDPCVYVLHDIQSAHASPLMVFAPHVDDFLAYGPAEHIRNFHACAHEFYSKTTFEALPFQHCGVNISRSSEGIVADQRQKLRSLSVIDIPPSEDDEAEASEGVLTAFRSAVGKMHFVATNTRPYEQTHC